MVASTLAGADLFVGRWNVDLTKWDFDPNTEPKRQTLTFRPEGNGMKVTMEGIDYRGDKIFSEYVAVYDGVARPVEKQNWDSVTDKRIGANMIERVYQKAGKTTHTVKYEVSPDGKALTVTSAGKTPSGMDFKATTYYKKE
jgi:hypothetical protein